MDHKEINAKNITVETIEPNGLLSNTNLPTIDVTATAPQTEEGNEKPKILYVIPFRGKNLYRKKNLKIVLQWTIKVKEYLSDNYGIIMDIFVVEQDREPHDQTPKDRLTHLFLVNNGIFNKGWGFNTVVKQLPTYQYYGFADADIIIPNIDTFCDQIADHCVVNPKKAFRPFNDRLDATLSDCALINTLDDLIINFPVIKGKLQKHGGLSFASNMIFMSKETYDSIGGWDEIFRGWGRYDDFITHKLSFICQCNGIYSPIEAVHLWHPVTLDYSLNSENVHLYDKYIKYSKNDLLKLIDVNRRTMGDPNLYKNK